MRFLAISFLGLSPLLASSTLSLTPEACYLTVEIDKINPTFYGALKGGNISYDYTKNHGLYFHVHANWMAGKIHARNQPHRFVHDEEVEARGGYAIQTHHLTFTPFLGYGFRLLIENREQTSLYTQVNFKYRKFYLPVGFDFDYKLSSCWSLGLLAEWMYDVAPMVKISGLKDSFWALEHEQGWLVQVPLRWSWGKRGDIVLSPFWEGYQLGRSHAQSSSGVPLGIYTQTLNYWGAKLGVELRF